MPANIKFGIALLQLNVHPDRDLNVSNAVSKIREAVAVYKPRMVCLAECFNMPYTEDNFDKYAEYVPSGYTCQNLAAVAKELKIYIMGGSIPERDEADKTKLYNTALVFGPDGQFITKHRKAHLFDADMKGVYAFSESKQLTCGTAATTFTVDGIKFGLGICFDIFFDEYSRALRNLGCDMLLFPSAFDTVYGPMHWDLLTRARANDNQVFVASICPAREEKEGFVYWGHSMFADPWGRVLAKAGVKEEIVFYEIDFAAIPSLREQIPLSQKRQPQLYYGTDTMKQY